MPDIEVKHLFQENRFPPTIRKLAYLMLYTPVGVVLIIIRILIGIIAIILALNVNVGTLNRTISKLLSFALGIAIQKENADKRSSNTKIIVSNHISHLDHFVLHLATGSITPSKYRMNAVFAKAFGNFFTNQPLTAEQIVNANNLLAIFPEEAITNGRGLLEFKSNIFEQNIKIQPIALKVCRPEFTDIAVNMIGSQWWSDIIAYLFVPYTLYTIKFLPVEKKVTLSESEFRETVRQAIANSLQIPCTSLTAKDMLEYEKRYMTDLQRIVHSPPSDYNQRNLAADHALDIMARQVKEVLPHVPHSVIIQDLVKTRNVDYTITNILEGHVRFVPESTTRTATSVSSSPSNVAITETVPISKSEINASSVNSSPSHAFNTASPTFHKSANERMLSFKERKRLLIENARQRYIEKHGLNSC